MHMIPKLGHSHHLATQGPFRQVVLLDKGCTKPLRGNPLPVLSSPRGNIGRNNLKRTWFTSRLARQQKRCPQKLGLAVPRCRHW